MANDRQELEDLRRIDELERKASGSAPKESPADKQQKELKKIQGENVIGTAAKESLGNLAHMGQGLVAGIPSLVGLPGEVEHLGRMAINAADKYGLSPSEKPPLSEETTLPRAEPIFKGMVRATEPMVYGKERPETEFMRGIGGALSPVPSVGGAKKATELGSALKTGFGAFSDKLASVSGKNISSAQRAAEESAASVRSGALSHAESKIADAAKEIEKQRIAGEGLAFNKDSSRVISENTQAVASKLKQAKDTAEAAVNSELSKLGKSKNEEEIGGLIQSAGQENVVAMKEARQEQAIKEQMHPSMEASRAKEAQGSFVQNNPESSELFNEARKDIETQLDRTSESMSAGVRKIYGDILGKERQMSEGEKRVEDLRASVQGRVPNYIVHRPATMDELKGLTQYLDDPKWWEKEGYSASKAAEGARLGGKIEQAMSKFETTYLDWKKTYREMSTGINKAESGSGRRFLRVSHITPDEERIFASPDKKAIADYFLNGTKERAERLMDFVGKKSPNLGNEVLALAKGKIENMDAAKAEEYISQGMFDVFPSAREALKPVVEAKKAAEKAASLSGKQGVITASGPTGRLGKALSTDKGLFQKLEGQIASSAAQAEKVKETMNKFETFKTTLTSLSPQDSLSASKRFLEKMTEEGRISQQEYQSALTDITAAEEKFTKTKDMKQLRGDILKSLAVKGAAALGLGIGAYGIGSAAKRMSGE